VTALALESLVLGLVFCATPGVVAAEALRRGLARGFRAALALQLGSLVGDTVWAVGALAGGAALLRFTAVRQAIGIIGGGLLLYLAGSALRDAVKQPRAAGGRPEPGTGPGDRRDFAVGAALSLGNPFAVAFWLGVGTSIVSARCPTPGILPFAVFLAGVTAGGVAWSFLFAGAVAAGRRRFTPAVFRAADGCCGAALAWLGLDLLRRTLA
jgi:threonine/homoserine/homoserine lactone efflux protein